MTDGPAGTVQIATKIADRRNGTAPASKRAGVPTYFASRVAKKLKAGA